jgi:uncharacterized protein (DUF2235 family)
VTDSGGRDAPKKHRNDRKSGSRHANARKEKSDMRLNPDICILWVCVKSESGSHFAVFFFAWNSWISDATRRGRRHLRWQRHLLLALRHLIPAGLRQAASSSSSSFFSHTHEYIPCRSPKLILSHVSLSCRNMLVASSCALAHSLHVTLTGSVHPITRTLIPGTKRTGTTSKHRLTYRESVV